MFETKADDLPFSGDADLAQGLYAIGFVIAIIVLAALLLRRVR